MTCIVAATDGREVVLGGDSFASGSRGSFGFARADSKVFRSGSYLMGFTTSFRMGQILRYETVFPEPPQGADADELEKFLVTDFVPVVRDSFKEHGFAPKASYPSSGGEDFGIQGLEVGGLFIVAVEGRLFEIREDFQVSRPAAGFSAIGSGAPPAQGALHALSSIPDMSLRDRVEAALSASEAYCTVVRGPFQILSSSTSKA